jgi:rod shape-determining protein MreB
MVLERTPPELVGDISENGLVLSGGGSLLYGMDKLVNERTGIATHVVDDALSCTAYGAGRMLSRLDSMRDGMMNFARRRQLDTAAGKK